MSYVGYRWVAGILVLALVPFAGSQAQSPAQGQAEVDNSHIVIIDQQQRSTPFGSYHSQRRTQVFGPSTGFRYEEYRTPVAPVYPQYRNGRHDGRYDRRYGRDDRRGSYAYGPSYRGHGSGRVVENPGRGAYGRYGAPAAPHVNERFGYGDHRRDRGDGDWDRARFYDDHNRFGSDTGRKVKPAERAVEPARRAIR